MQFYQIRFFRSNDFSCDSGGEVDAFTVIGVLNFTDKEKYLKAIKRANKLELGHELREFNV